MVIADWPVVFETLATHKPPLLRLETFIDAGLFAAAPLLKEINEINVGVRQMRCSMKGSGVVLNAELVIHAIPPGDLAELAGRMSERAQHRRPLIGAVFG